jgi:RNA polymerase sigma-70 factor, ECF subfamily
MEEVLTAPPPIAAVPSASLDLDALFREAAGDVFAYVATLTGDRALAEDVVAQAFERAWSRRRSYRAGRGSPRAWLFGIARNAALDELRRRRRVAAPLDDVPDGGADLADELARRATVAAALARLDARDRELVALRFHAGLSHEEAGRVLGISASNAATRLHRALTRLRELCDA